MNPLGRLERNIEGEPEYKKIPPEPISVFRDASQSEAIVLPEKYKNRKCTDVAFIIVLIVFILFMTAFTLYLAFRKPPTKAQSIKNNQHDRNVSRNNNNDNKDFLKHGKKHGGITKSENKKKKYSNDINVKNWCLTTILMPLLGIVSCLCVFAGLHWCTKGCFWFLAGFPVVLLLIFTAGAWIFAFVVGSIILYAHAVICTIALIICVVVIRCFRKRMKLITLIYEEALKAIFKVPMVLFTPVLTILWILIVYLPVGVCCVVIIGERVAMDAVLKGYSALMTLQSCWTLMFVKGSQTFVVAGSIATYYFTRDKSKLGSPYSNSLRIYIRFHTGTVAAGSLIIAILSTLRGLLETEEREATERGNTGVACLACVCGSCLECCQEIAEYLTTKAYIMSSIHGKPLCTSGKRACRLLWSNLLDTVLVDLINDCALTGTCLLIIIATTAMGVFFVYDTISSMSGGDELFYYGVVNGVFPLFIGVFLVLLIICYFLDIISIAVQTVFLCFCEDKEINDGSKSRPYFMSQGLLNVVQTAFKEKYGSANVQP